MPSTCLQNCWPNLPAPDADLAGRERRAHGAEPKIGPVKVTLTACRSSDGGLDLTVADDGAGFGSQTTGTGLGLANIRDRLQQIYQGRAGLTLKAGPEGGVVATLHLPPEPTA
jgi:sensor histidine kinase YesM